MSPYFISILEFEMILNHFTEMVSTLPRSCQHHQNRLKRGLYAINLPYNYYIISKGILTSIYSIKNKKFGGQKHVNEKNGQITFLKLNFYFRNHFTSYKCDRILYNKIAIIFLICLIINKNFKFNKF